MKVQKNTQVANDALMGLVVAILGVIYLIFTMNLPNAAIGNANEPKYFPLLIAGILIIVGIVFVFKSGVSNIPIAMNNFKQSFIEDKDTNFMILLTCIGSVVYALVFRKLGFVFSTFFFLSLLLYITRKEKLIANTVVAAVFSMTIYLLFSKLLGVSLPPMPFINF